MGIRQLESQLKGILSDSYGGPAISWDEQKSEFVLFSWGDAPVTIYEMGRGRNLDEMLADYNLRKRMKGK